MSRASWWLASAALLAALLAPARARAEDGDDDDDDDTSVSAPAPGQPAPPPPPPKPRILAPPDEGYVHAGPRNTPDVAWLAFQLLPSPQVGFGAIKRIDEAGRVSEGVEPAFGLRWQVTPLLYSFGSHRRISPWRSMVVDPMARVSGSIELHGTFDLFLGHLDTLLVRPGVRTTLPLVGRGEQLAFSFGTSAYRNDGWRVSYDAGLWVLSGFVGFEATVAPWNDSLRAIGTLHFRVMH